MEWPDLLCFNGYGSGVVENADWGREFIQHSGLEEIVFVGQIKQSNWQSLM